MRVHRPRWLLAGLWWIVTGGAADLALTLWGLRLGAIEEANPLMAPLVTAHPALAVVVKLVVAGAAVLVFHQAYPLRRRLVAAGVLVVSLCLAGVLLLHGSWVSHFFRCA
ncbi:MAG TPA: DUF5658 family protein [Symbiobacteriaceae bacterium]|nr:DUF5658 family protein [Symbiobacteriaceae bacterium]